MFKKFFKACTEKQNQKKKKDEEEMTILSVMFSRWFNNR